VSESGFNNSFSPLIFVRPVGFTAADSLRLMQAAGRIHETVRWRLTPPGVMADVYLAHADAVRYGESPKRSGDSSGSTESTESSGSSGSGPFTSSIHEYQTLYLDRFGHHKNCPVCVLGEPSPMAEDPLDVALPKLVYPDVLRQLEKGLRRAEQELISQRMLYALGSFAWEQRQYWKTHRLQLQYNSRLIGTIVPHQWQIHLLEECRVNELDQASVQLVPQSAGFAAPGFDVVSLETALWEFAKRCPEGLLSKMVPTLYLSQPLTHRRATSMSPRILGDHCSAVLRLLDTGSLTAEQIEVQLRLSRPALLRSLACLALIRAIHPEPRPQSLWDRLSKIWQKKRSAMSRW
jgi:hypothetical protein